MSGKRVGRGGKERIPEIAEVINHYRRACQARLKSKGWVDYPIDGAKLWHLFFREPERPVLAWILGEYIDRYFAAGRIERSKISLAYILWAFEQETEARRQRRTA
jgi:hypothetical protein